jgi:hypothetical protein
VQDAVEYLRGHADYNLLFFEDGREPDRPLPEPRDFVAEVAKLTAAGDVEGLAALAERERSSHGRETLVQAAEAAVEALGGSVEAVERARLVAACRELDLEVPEEATLDDLREALDLMSGRVEPPEGDPPPAVG